MGKSKGEICLKNMQCVCSFTLAKELEADNELWLSMQTKAYIIYVVCGDE